jgi:hypothetical protein
MRRLLAVATVPVWPAREGYALRVASLLAELARDWEITLLAPAGDSDAAARAGIAEFVSVSMPGRWTLMPSQYDTRPLRSAAEVMVGRQQPAAALLWSGAEFLAFGNSSFPGTVADRVDVRNKLSVTTHKQQKSQKFRKQWSSL